VLLLNYPILRTQKGDDELQLSSCGNHRYAELIKCKVEMTTLLARELRN